MKFQDPLYSHAPIKGETVIFAGNNIVEDVVKTTSNFVHHNNECFVVSDGDANMHHASLAASFVSETAIWGYKLVRQRPYYWADKHLLLKRIFRSTNLAIWQKRREPGIEEGLTASLGIVIVSNTKAWIGSVGDIPIYLYRESLIDEITPLDIATDGTMTNMLGIKRLGLVPHIAIENFIVGDCFVIASPSVSEYIDEEELRATLEMTGDTEQSVAAALVHILGVAKEHGSNKSLSACIIKKIRQDSL